MTQMQRQMTMLGLPIPLLMLCISAAAIGAVSCIIFDWLPATLPVAGGLFIGMWRFFHRRCRVDIHYDRSLIKASRFWRGNRVHRHLLAGGGLR
ncbi:hypothetical protein [Telmatospirillum sp. J64-1]|uniref:hypothetical protein n=1 Tax=Telmatospirillum sp. J64-1 TaxID=2502183 RepID=UPI00115D2F89|nr:hypothetical protein [Telmatospirillum sp. J64-1]